MARLEREYDDDTNHPYGDYFVYSDEGRLLNRFPDNESGRAQAEAYFHEVQQLDNQKRIISQNQELINMQKVQRSPQPNRQIPNPGYREYNYSQRMPRFPQSRIQELDPEYKEWLQFKKETDPEYKKWKRQKDIEKAEKEAKIKAEQERALQETIKKREQERIERERIEAERKRKAEEEEQRRKAIEEENRRKAEEARKARIIEEQKRKEREEAEKKRRIFRENEQAVINGKKSYNGRIITEQEILALAMHSQNEKVIKKLARSKNIVILETLKKNTLVSVKTIDKINKRLSYIKNVSNYGFIKYWYDRCEDYFDKLEEHEPKYPLLYWPAMVILGLIITGIVCGAAVFIIYYIALLFAHL